MKASDVEEARGTLEDVRIPPLLGGEQKRRRDTRKRTERGGHGTQTQERPVDVFEMEQTVFKKVPKRLPHMY